MQMASEQTQLCLSWNTYSENIIQSLEANFSDSEFVDVTLTCKEETLKAHKVVLSACSSYLKQLLRENPCQHPIIILSDISAHDLRCLLNYMYQGEVKIERDRLNSFIKAAKQLGIRGLSDIETPEDPVTINKNYDYQNDSENVKMKHRYPSQYPDNIVYNTKNEPDYFVKEEKSETDTSNQNIIELDMIQPIQSYNNDPFDQINFSSNIAESVKSGSISIIPKKKKPTKSASLDGSGSFQENTPNKTCNDQTPTYSKQDYFNGLLENQPSPSTSQEGYDHLDTIFSSKKVQLQLLTCGEFKKYTNILLMSVFGRDILATHTLNGTGTSKPPLDKKKVGRIIRSVVEKFNVSEYSVKEAIRIKLNNEDKLKKRKLGIDTLKTPSPSPSQDEWNKTL